MTEVDGQFTTDEQARAMQAGFHGGNREIERFGDFAVRQALDVAHHHDGFVEWLQLIQGCPHQAVDFAPGISLFDGFRPVDHGPGRMVAVFIEFRQIFFVWRLFLRFAPAHSSQCGIHSQTIEPRVQLRVSLKAPGFLKSRPENILDNFFGIRRIAQNSLRQIVEPGGIKVENFFQSVLVARFETADQLNLACRRAHSAQCSEIAPAPDRCDWLGDRRTIPIHFFW